MKNYLGMAESQLVNEGFHLVAENDDMLGDGDIYNTYASAWCMVGCQDGKVTWVED